MKFKLSQYINFLTHSVVLFLVACILLPYSVAEAKSSQGDSLWAQVMGKGDPTIVFISGNGNDSSVWADIVPEVQKLGVRTVVYDRAGLGQSKLTPGDYNIENEANALNLVLDKNAIDDAIVLVAHSYGGLIAILASETNPSVKGIVLVDALLPDDLSDEVVASTLAEYTPKFKKVEEVAPELAKAVIPVVKAYPATAKRMQRVIISKDLLFIDIIAEQSWQSIPEQLTYIRDVHSNFSAASAMRETIFAKDSSHNVMRDRPDVINHAISQMLTSYKNSKPE